MQNAYINTKVEVIDMFLDRTPGESTTENRLVTRENESGNVELIAYGWLKLAEYNERRGVVTIFSGHKPMNSQAVNRYLNDVELRAKERGRDLNLSGASPTINTPNTGVRYIGRYVGDLSARKSPVESTAIQNVVESIPSVPEILAAGQ